MLFLLCQTCLHCFEPLPGFLEFFSWHLPAFLLEAVQDVDHVIYPRQVNHAIPSSLILISQFKNAGANRRQWSVVAWSLSLLKLPKLESEVLSYCLGERVENLLGVALPGHDRGPLWRFGMAPHKTEY